MLTLSNRDSPWAALAYLGSSGLKEARTECEGNSAQKRVHSVDRIYMCFIIKRKGQSIGRREASTLTRLEEESFSFLKKETCPVSRSAYLPFLYALPSHSPSVLQNPLLYTLLLVYTSMIDDSIIEIPIFSGMLH